MYETRHFPHTDQLPAADPRRTQRPVRAPQIRVAELCRQYTPQQNESPAHGNNGSTLATPASRSEKAPSSPRAQDSFPGIHANPPEKYRRTPPCERLVHNAFAALLPSAPRKWRSRTLVEFSLHAAAAQAISLAASATHAARHAC